MPAKDQLEIIGPDGSIEFRDLDPAKGVANIGRHPANDIVIDSPNVGLFHAVLNLSSSPYHVTLLDQDGGTRVAGKELFPNTPTAMHDLQALEVGGYSILLLTQAGAAPRPSAAVIPVPPPAAPPAPPAAPPASGFWGKVGKSLPDPLKKALPAPAAPAAPATAATLRQAAQAMPTPAVVVPSLPPQTDHLDEVIVVEISERQWVAEVNQAITCQVIITNGGDIVANFDLLVEGLDPSWVTITPPEVNLNEGERATLSVIMNAPRASSSRAGPHHLAIVVTSPNYPDRVSRLGATLTINPYYEFAVSDISPKQQTIGGRKGRGEATVNIANKGNGDATFRLEGLDDARTLNFEFDMPGESTRLARQAEMRLPPEETFAIPFTINPTARPWVGIRGKRHSYTITATMLEGQMAPRSLLAEVRVQPLIGPLLLLLIGLLLAALIVIIFRPRIYEFAATPGIIEAGEPVTLSWRASAFSDLQLETDAAGVIVPAIDRPNDQVVLYPEQSQTYTLRAENWLSQLITLFNRFRDSFAAQSVLVNPVYPIIRVFSLDRSTMVVGEMATLRWDVQLATGVTLSTNNSPETLLSTEFTSQRILNPLQAGTYVYELEASNQYGTVRAEPLTLIVREPTPTPLPPPLIQRFTAAPLSITQGQTVTLEWETSGATQVHIASMSLNQDFPPNGLTIHAPPATTAFVLTAIYEVGGVQVSVDSPPVNVIVNPAPTPTPVPVMPVIENFAAVPVTVVRGANTPVQLVWTVSGETTDIEISGPLIGTINNLAVRGTLPIAATDTTFFVLTAYNGELNTSKTAVLTVVEPPPPTPTPLPLPEILLFEAYGLTPSDRVEMVDQLASTIYYRCNPGTQVGVEWEVINATVVTLFKNNTAQGGPRPLEGRYDDLEPIISQLVTYRLHAENAAGAFVDHYIEINPLDLQIPPPPYDVSGGPVDATTVQVTWNYDPTRSGTSADLVYPIVGFVVYRAADPFTNFVAVADETVNSNTTCPCSWQEQSGIHCGQAYYVTAVYLDRYGNRQETQASAERYYSGPCPTPTPLP